MSFSSGSFTFLGKDVQGVLGLNKCAEASVFCRQISYYYTSGTAAGFERCFGKFLTQWILLLLYFSDKANIISQVKDGHLIHLDIVCH